MKAKDSTKLSEQTISPNFVFFFHLLGARATEIKSRFSRVQTTKKKKTNLKHFYVSSPVLLYSQSLKRGRLLKGVFVWWCCTA